MSYEPREAGSPHEPLRFHPVLPAPLPSRPGLKGHHYPLHYLPALLFASPPICVSTHLLSPLLSQNQEHGCTTVPSNETFLPGQKLHQTTETQHRAESLASTMSANAPPGSEVSRFSAALTCPQEGTQGCSVDISYAIFLKYCLSFAETETGSGSAVLDFMMP